MSNLTNSEQERNFEDQVQDFTVGFTGAVSALAPLIATLCTLAVGVASGYIEYLFQSAIIGNFALFTASVIAGFRFASGMAGVQLIKRKHYMPGMFSVAVALAFTILTAYHAATIADTINPERPNEVAIILQSFLWGSFIGELMIAGYLATVGKKGKGLPPLGQWLTFSTNGKHQTQGAEVN